MLIDRKSGRTGNEDRQLAVALAGCAGMLNVLALGAFGLFPSNMTGNATQLSKELLQWDKLEIIPLVLLLSCFLCGAFTSRIAVSLAKKINLRTIYAHILLVEGVLLIAPIIVGFWYPQNLQQGYYLFGLSFLLGVHNATSTQLSQGKVRTTHITGTLTDAGIVIANLLLHPVLRHPPAQMKQFRYLLSVYFTSFTSFLIGGLIGILGYDLWGINAFILAGSILLAVSLLTLIRVMFRKRGKALQGCTAER
ncbi:YoaK family protein [Rosenbergiella australiborealis]|uniref:DUF1275 domain-containing protein n=1 Tax=Rosenbergiella australiborealis TaxID=1544696 RepID=A0ABS5T623_9GAMM|nr:YoaK family protein [Rosenbergiella australiborealis]MBT0727203.1 DUF1275 domain-containing protein [Rosenbergiella australiborealis]